MPNIKTQTEARRGCGYRKKGGIYLVSDGAAATCFKLPIALTVCPCCSNGIKPTRGFTWINSKLFSDTPCNRETLYCMKCPANLKNTHMGLLWVGEKFYPTPEDFTKESGRQGISRRLSQLPNDFKLGETWVCLAHRKAIPCTKIDGELLDPKVSTEYIPGIFSIFRPQRIEYIVIGNETDEQLQRLEKRGFSLVDVIPEQRAIF